MSKIAILGSGSWGSAIADLLSDKNDIFIYARRSEQIDEWNNHHTNNRYISNKIFRNNIKASNDLKEVICNAEFIINAIPTQNSRAVFKELSEIINPKTLIVNLSKGIEKGSGKRISEILNEEIPNAKYAICSGPSHAEEVVLSQPTSLIIACNDIEIAEFLQIKFMRDNFRVYTGTDVIGVELGGAVKNVLAIAIGIADGLGMGDNAKAATITRGIHEMVKFGNALGADTKTLYGLAGLGDLIVTATSKHSRNRMAGELIGKGYQLRQVQNLIGQTIEGVMTCEAVYNLSEKIGVEMPITDMLYKILFKEMEIQASIYALMNRERKKEFED